MDCTKLTITELRVLLESGIYEKLPIVTRLLDRYLQLEREGCDVEGLLDERFWAYYFGNDEQQGQGEFCDANDDACAVYENIL